MRDDWRGDLEVWLAPFLAALRHKTRIRLSERGSRLAVGVSRRQNVYRANIGPIFPEVATGRRRKYHIPDDVAVSAELMLTDAKWQTISWRRGTKGRLTCRFAARRVRVAEGPTGIA